MADPQITVHQHTDKPSKAWEMLQVKQKSKEVSNKPPKNPVSLDHVRVVCMSDTHGRVEKSGLPIPDGDILIHAGDFTQKGQLREIRDFNQYLGSLPHKHKIVIAGNHDITFDNELLSSPKISTFGISKQGLKSNLDKLGLNCVTEMLTNCIYLQDSSVCICGIHIYGSPWQPAFCNWAFNAERGRDILSKWNQIPNTTDILVTHGPPVGYGDLTSGNNNVGCVELLNTVQERVQPKYHIFGHIHEGYGAWNDGRTTFVNASTCTSRYKASNSPFVFDYPIPEGHSKEELLQSTSELLLQHN